MSGILDVLMDTAASAAGHAGNALKMPTMLIDFHTYKPPEELRVNFADVHAVWWDEPLTSGESVFKTAVAAAAAARAANGVSVSGTDKNEQAEHDEANGGSNGTALPPAAAMDPPPTPSPSFSSPAEQQAQAPATLPPGGEEESDKLDPVTKDILKFQEKVFLKSGLSKNGTYLPKSIHPKYSKNNPRTDLKSSMEECKMAVTGAVEGLLHKLGIRANQIDILVTTCSIYCPTPSMASMVVNHFKMRNDIHTSHLGGMGCANGVIAINLVRDLLKAHPNSNVLLVCNETTTPALYLGKDKHRLVTNVLFRMGASAILLSNKPQWLRNGKAKYVLSTAQRVHLGASEAAYRAIFYGPDSEGLNGIYLGLNVVQEATKALTVAMHKAGRYLLTNKQLLEAAWHYTQKYLGTKTGPLQPCFAEGVQHFLIHAGGAKVLDGIGASLKLTEYHLEPSRAVLYDYGNVSSSTTWYTLSYIEAVRGTRKGDKVLQIGVGSGIKCGVNVWKALRNIDDSHDAWEHRMSDARRATVLAQRKPSSSLLLVLFLLSLLVAVLAVALQYLGYRLPLSAN